MRLQALLLCSDEKIERVLRRVLGDLEINIEHCADADAAVRKLTRDCFEAVIVDYNPGDASGQVLKSARSSPRNKRSVAVAIMDHQQGMSAGFDLGAHFLLYKPITAERARASFRAARALMKKERRHNARIPVKIPVTLVLKDGGGQIKTFSSDLGEGGIAIGLSQRLNVASPVGLVFSLPGAEQRIECFGEIAWESGGQQAGIRFLELSSETKNRIKNWVESQADEMEGDDPPVPCRLTDLSSGGCYTELAAPFPSRTKIVLSMQSGDTELKVEGIVRVAHPEVGMGVEFARETAQQRQQLETFIQALMSNDGAVPELLVRPEGLDSTDTQPETLSAKADPLLELFRTKSNLPADVFQSELERQRGVHPEAENAVPA